MRAIFYIAALACFNVTCVFGFGSSYREAHQNYYEILMHCQREGGECIQVDFGETSAPPTVPPTLPTTLLPTFPPILFQTTPPPVFVPAWPAAPQIFMAPRTTSRAPPMTTRVPPLTVRMPSLTTRSPPVTTRSPRRTPATETPEPIETPEPVQTTKKPTILPKQRNGIKGRKKGNGKAKGKRITGEQEIEREVRKRRQIGEPDPFFYLYNECTGGWEFDVGCGGQNSVCCFSSGSTTK